MKTSLFLILLLFLAVACGTEVRIPRSSQTQSFNGPQWLSSYGVTASTLAVIINDNDPQSIAVGNYYQQKRKIPVGNVIHVTFTAGNASISQTEFNAVKNSVEALLPSGIQAYALTWTTPYLVDCMSITSAFALGFDTKYCNTSGNVCGSTAAVSYYGSEAVKPLQEKGLRPTMMLAATSFENAKALIDRGINSDSTQPEGTAYMIRTTDPIRSVRYPYFSWMANSWNSSSGVQMSYTDNSTGATSDYISGKTDVLFYFTGLTSVPSIETNTYLPGAVADHVTSYGGMVPTSYQMSALRFLEAGATASFGTVVEPCNYTTKFPDVMKLIPFYYRGNTIVEAYWKSVYWPGEGLFIGEPLARPFGDVVLESTSNQLVIQTTALLPNTLYHIEGADSESGPFQSEGSSFSVPEHKKTTLTIPSPTRKYYRLVKN